MEIFVFVMTALFAIGVIAEKDSSKSKLLATCFCISMATLVILEIL